MQDLTPGGGGGRGGRAMPSAEGARPATGEAAATSTDDVARVITQQAAVADFGRFVMESWNIAGSIERAVDIVAGVLQVPVAAVLQVLDSGRAAVVHSRGPVATALGEQSPLNLGGATPRARATTPVMVEPRTEPGVDRPRSADVVRGPHSLSVPVPVGGRSWGRLVAADEAPRRFSGTEVAFVLSVANVLAAALERERVESGRAAVAAFGRFALQSREITATMDQALEVVTRVLGMPVGVVVATVGAPGQPGRMAVMRTTGPIGMQPGLEYDLGDNLPDAYFTHEPLIIEDWRNDRTFTAFRAEHVSHLVASVSVSVLVEGRLWGRLIAADTGPRRFSASEIDIISSVADMLAKALEREQVAQAHAAVAAFGRSALASRDISATIEGAVDVVMEVLNAPMGSVIRPLARPGRFAVVYGRGPIGLAAGQEYDVAPELMALHGTAEPLAVPDWNTETRFPRVRAGQAAGVQATLSVSVLVDGRAWGRLSVFWAGPRQLSGADVDVIQSIAHVLAAALERDRIETRLRRTAQDLQRALLPGALPTAAGIVTAARYAPAGGDQVGGDWYDVLELPQGGVGLVMGDVEGHDTAAAAVMGQVRNVLRAYASEGHSPAEVMTRVNRFVLRHTELLVTCCYAELHPAERSLTCVTAGHPAPLLLAPDGSSHPVQLVPGALLGVDEVHYAEQTAVLPTGATLLLVTDGLVDDLPGAIHPGPDAFAAVAHDRVGGSVDALADALITRPPGAPVQRDDAALLVVRLTAPAVAGDGRSAAGGVDGAGAGSGGAGGRAAGGTVGGRAGGGTVGGRTVGGTVVGTVVGTVGGDAVDQAHRVFAPIPESIRAARHFVRDMLAGWDLAALEETAALAVSELVTNTVVHTTSPIHLTLRRKGPARLWIGVYDDSDRFVRRRHAADDEISGRGLAIVESIAADWGVEPVPGGSGKTVWVELGGPTGPLVRR